MLYRLNVSDPEIQSAKSWNKVFQANIFVNTFAEYFKQANLRNEFTAFATQYFFWDQNRYNSLSKAKPHLYVV